MSERCEVCEHEKAMGRCWRLTCPTNGAGPQAFSRVRPASENDAEPPRTQGKLL